MRQQCDSVWGCRSVREWHLLVRARSLRQWLLQRRPVPLRREHGVRCIVRKLLFKCDCKRLRERNVRLWISKRALLRKQHLCWVRVLLRRDGCGQLQYDGRLHVRRLRSVPTGRTVF